MRVIRLEFPDNTLDIFKDYVRDTLKRVMYEIDGPPVLVICELCKRCEATFSIEQDPVWAGIFYYKITPRGIA